MKTIKIFKRTILERTGYRKYPFKEEIQFIIIDRNSGKTIANSDRKEPEDPSLKVKFSKIIETRSEKNLIDFMKSHYARRSDRASLWLKSAIASILAEIKEEK